MLKKRSRTVTNNQAFMADSSSLPSPTDKYKRTTSSFFSSPRLFLTGFSAKSFSESEALMSPTSILDTKLFSGIGNPFWSDKNTTTKSYPEPCLENRHPWEKKLDSRGVGLGIVDSLNEEPDQKFSKHDSRMVVFGSQLKIQIPPVSPTDFGIKTRNSKLGSLSPCSARNSTSGSSNSGLETSSSPRIFTGCLSASEMESSEDYTCVITYGPNPRTTHIFDDCVVDNCYGSTPRKGISSSFDQSSYPSENFLSFCYTCKKNLGQGKDIYMYRGEKAFCSNECRYQEMLFDEGVEKSELDDSLRTCP